jgi:hypothetical protein
MARRRPRSPVTPLEHQTVYDAAFPHGESNVLNELLKRMTPLEQQGYRISPELRRLTLVMLGLAVLTMAVFPILPEDVTVGGWALWWLGGWITWIMEFSARLWPVAVALGTVFLFLDMVLVVASRWLHEAPKHVQLLLFASPLLLLPNVLALGIILASWMVVILIWVGIAATALAILGLLLTPWVRWHIPMPPGLGWARGLAQWHWCFWIALCHVLVGSILLLCSVQLAGISMFLVVLGITCMFMLVFPHTRAQPIDNLAPVYFGVGGTALVFALYTIYS